MDDYMASLMASRRQPSKEGSASENKNSAKAVAAGLVSRPAPSTGNNVPPAEPAPAASAAEPPLQPPSAAEAAVRERIEAVMLTAQKKIDQMLEDKETAEEQFKELHNFSSLFFLQENLEDALDFIFAAADSFFDVDAIELMHLDEDVGVVYLFSMNDESTLLWNEIIEYKGTELEQRLAAQQVSFIDDIAEARFNGQVFSSTAEHQEMASMMQLPVSTLDTFWGFLNFFSRETETYDQEAQELALVFANMLGVFLERITLKEKLTHSRETAAPQKEEESKLILYIQKELEQLQDELYQNAMSLTNKKISPKLESKQKDLLEQIIDASAETKKKLVQIQEYIALTSGQVKAEFKRLDLGKVLKDVMSFLKPRIETKTVRVMMEMEPKFPPVLSDNRILYRVLYAIIENALEITKIGGLFKIVVTQGRSYAEIRIIDFAMESISQEDFTNLLTPFSKFEHTLSNKRGKMFLNMPVVYMYTKILDGELEIQSVREQGTIFTVKVPFA